MVGSGKKKPLACRCAVGCCYYKAAATVGSSPFGPASASEPTMAALHPASAPRETPHRPASHPHPYAPEIDAICAATCDEFIAVALSTPWHDGIPSERGLRMGQDELAGLRRPLGELRRAGISFLQQTALAARGDLTQETADIAVSLLERLVPLAAAFYDVDDDVVASLAEEIELWWDRVREFVVENAA